MNSLNTMVRDSKIGKKEAQAKYSELIGNINGLYKNDAAPNTTVFPLKGYTTTAIGGTKGEGYKPAGYNYFDGNDHKGHPAHDIFINDKDQDCKDDNTGKEVTVLAVQSGIVIAAENNWDTTSALRGGKYLYIFNPVTNIIFYYAHNQKLLVQPGNYIKAGQAIAYVGRTGANAFKQRSPTHLHLMELRLDTNLLPKPVNSYDLLKKAQLIN
jgi:hypothetical protein